MRRMIMATVGLMLLGGVAATAQTGSGRSAGPSSGSAAPATPSVPPSLTPDERLTGTAPVGHRQPRADPALGDPTARDPADVALDRKLRSICRGC